VQGRLSHHGNLPVGGDDDVSFARCVLGVGTRAVLAQVDALPWAERERPVRDRDVEREAQQIGIRRQVVGVISRFAPVANRWVRVLVDRQRAGHVLYKEIAHATLKLAKLTAKDLVHLVRDEVVAPPRRCEAQRRLHATDRRVRHVERSGRQDEVSQ